MKRTMPEGVGVVGAFVAGVMMALGPQAAARQAPGDSKEPSRGIRADNVDAVPDIPVLVDIPELVEPRGDAISKPLPRRPQTPGLWRKISIFQRHLTPLDLWSLGSGPDGLETFICRGGVVIISKSLKYGTVRIEAEEAEIVRGPVPKDESPDRDPADTISRENADLQMRVRFKGNVVVNQTAGETAGQDDRRTIRAREVEFDYVTNRLTATHARMEISAAGSLAPVLITSPSIEIHHALERLPDGSLAPSANRENHPDVDEKAIRD
jgi:hypothetical protein